jgi:hypothetical protein
MRRGTRGITSALHKDLTATNTLLRNQLTSEEPTTPDIPYPTIKRNKVYTLQQSFVGPSITGSTTLETDGSLALSLSSLPDASSLAALFDTYRFVAIKMAFMPTGGPDTGSLSAPIYTAIDYDDTNTTAISALVQYDTLKVAPPFVYFERSFKPRVANALYSGAFTSFGQQTNQWIDTVSSSVQQYGIKWGVPTSGNQPSWSTTIHCVVQFKNTR